MMKQGGVSASLAAHDRERDTLLDKLARQYTPALGRFFNRRVDNKSDVADLVQDVFLRLSRLSDAKLIREPEHYLFTTAASALRDRARRNVVRRFEQHPVCDSEFVGSDFTPERVLAGRHAIAQLEAALRELPERSRHAFVLRVWEDFKMADVARILGISQRAAEKHYAKAMAHVTESLKHHRDG
jgi:RNA polymerase sigma factor (sigma-70 family)